MAMDILREAPNSVRGLYEIARRLEGARVAPRVFDASTKGDALKDQYVDRATAEDRPSPLRFGADVPREELPIWGWSLSFRVPEEPDSATREWGLFSYGLPKETAERELAIEQAAATLAGATDVQTLVRENPLFGWAERRPDRERMDWLPKPDIAVSLDTSY
jgi:hypothetical protein